MINKVRMDAPIYKLNMGNYSTVQVGGSSIEIERGDDEDMPDFVKRLMAIQDINNTLLYDDIFLITQELEMGLTKEEVKKMSIRQIGKKMIE